MNYFAPNGVHVLVDGQFGSTGKGLLASWLARKAHEQKVIFDGVISNAGPNSGHTFYHDGEKHVLKQLPTFAVKTYLLGGNTRAILSAGAIIDPEILRKEAEKHSGLVIYVHPNAAVIDDEAKIVESVGSIAAVAGTRSGTGAAIARKVFREEGAIWGNMGHRRFDMPGNVVTMRMELHIQPFMQRYFMEVSQGFSLGLNSEFYPKVTSRECTVMQAISDARIPPRFVAKTYMVIRTFPIRVGNVDGFDSGGVYPDQEEISWQDLGVEPERTTVTNRIRRVFTFSSSQYIEALRANWPDLVLVNFMNYFKTEQERSDFRKRVEQMGYASSVEPSLLYGYGPNDEDITPF